LLEDIEITVVEPPNPANKGKKRPALLLFGIDVNDGTNVQKLTAACCELGSFLMDRENKQSLVLPAWNGREITLSCLPGSLKVWTHL
jgi:hypothetical protein